MRKEEFLAELNRGISRLPKADIDERIEFYSEMIDDLIEEGLSEEDAVSRIGSVDEITSKIIADIPQSKAKKEKTSSKRGLHAWEIVLIILGSPIWLSLGLAAFAVIFSLYISLWSIIISLWAVFASFIGSGIGCIAIGIVHIVLGNTAIGIALIGASLILAGLSILLFFGCRELSKAIAKLTSNTISGIINRFCRKEKIQ